MMPNINLILTLVLVISQIGLGGFIFFKNPRNEINIVFSGFVLLFALWNYCAYYATHCRIGGLIWADRLIFVPAMFLLAFFLYFSFVFPNKANNFQQRQKILVFSFPLFLSSLIPFNLIIKDVEIRNGTALPIFGLAYPGFVAYALIYILLGLQNLIHNYYVSSGVDKLRIRYVLVGTALSFTFLVFSNLLLPWMGEARLAPFGSFFTFFFLLFTAYAITKHRLLDIFVVISRSVAEILAILLYGAIYLGLVWLYLTYVSASLGLSFLTGAIIYGIFVGQTHYKLRLFFQTTADKVFLRGKYNYSQQLAEISSCISRSLSLDNICDCLRHVFFDVIESVNPRFYFSADFNQPELAPYLGLTAPTFIGQELVVPCRAYGQLFVLFVLGHKLSEDPYSEDDIKLLTTLASQTAMALHHLQAYEEMLKIQEQLLLAEKLTELGKLAGEISQKINEPLSFIAEKANQLKRAIHEHDTAFLLNFQVTVPPQLDKINQVINEILVPLRER